MALTSSSTLTDALAQYNNNLLWDGDPAKAALALEAARWLKANRPQQSTRESVQFNWEVLDEEIKSLSNFVNASSSNRSRARVADVTGR